jgi:hypothetical protein
MNSLVVLGWYVPPKEGVRLQWGRYMTGFSATSKIPEHKVTTVTFTFGHLVIQTIIGA